MVDLQQLICCWADVLEGRGCICYRILFCPFVIVYHAIRIFVGSCLCIYGNWALRPRCCKGICWDEYEDPDFPPTYQSIGQLKGDVASGILYGAGDVEWVRASEIVAAENEADGHPGAQLFEGEIEATDLHQGQIGDCWLIAAMACIAERPEIVHNCILSKSVDARGLYYFRLWNQIKSEEGSQFVDIFIDDYIPCNKGTKEPKFAKHHNNEMWAMLLEKAFAKMYGSYAALEGGLMSWGLTAITGNPAVLFDKNNGRFWRSAQGGYYTDDEFTDEEFFKFLHKLRRNGAFICCAGIASSQRMGLIDGHAYSIRKITKVQHSVLGGEYLQMVQIRNPHGGGEWKGAWSDNSTAWQQYPGIKKQLVGNEELEEDGSFWMQWQDFVKFWKGVHVVDCETNIRTVAIPVYDEGKPCGPVTACVRGCCGYWCCCIGCKRLYLGRKGAHDVQGMKKDMDRNCGIDQDGVYCNLLEKKAVEYSESDSDISG